MKHLNLTSVTAEEKPTYEGQVENISKITTADMLYCIMNLERFSFIVERIDIKFLPERQFLIEYINVYTSIHSSSLSRRLLKYCPF